MSEQTIPVEQPRNLGGRPSNYNDETVRNLVGALQLGLSVSTACDLAGISRDTYYTWLKEKDGFSDKMTKAQHHSKVISANIVSDVLQDHLRVELSAKAGKDVKHKYSHELRVNTAKWMLEKQEREKFGSQSMIAAKVESDGKGGQTATVIYATDNQFNQLLDKFSTIPGSEEIDPGQLLEVLEDSGAEADLAGGAAEERPAPVHPEELQSEHTEEQSLSES